MKIKVWTKDERHIEIRHKVPRRYMCGWEFKKLLKYISEELYWADVDKDEVECIEIVNEKEGWVQPILKNY